MIDRKTESLKMKVKVLQDNMVLLLFYNKSVLFILKCPIVGYPGHVCSVFQNMTVTLPLCLRFRSSGKRPAGKGVKTV